MVASELNWERPLPKWTKPQNPASKADLIARSTGASLANRTNASKADLIARSTSVTASKGDLMRQSRSTGVLPGSPTPGPPLGNPTRRRGGVLDDS